MRSHNKMRRKEYTADFQGHEIRVSYRTLFGAKLYIDGDCRDTCSEFFALSSKHVFLSTVLSAGGQDRDVDVFVNPFRFAVRMKICVDGKRVAGDPF